MDYIAIKYLSSSSFLLVASITLLRRYAPITTPIPQLFFHIYVSQEGLEPSCLTALEPKSRASCQFRHQDYKKHGMHPVGEFSLSLSEPLTLKPTSKTGLYCLHGSTVHRILQYGGGIHSGMIREPLEPQSSTLPIELWTPCTRFLLFSLTAVSRVLITVASRARPYHLISLN